jgi:hypothetical protein
MTAMGAATKGTANFTALSATFMNNLAGVQNNPALIESAVRAIESKLDERGWFNDVTHAELQDISTTLEQLTPQQANEVISRLSGATLSKWSDEINSNGLAGTGGLNADERTDLFNNLASNLKLDQLARVYHAVDDTGMQSELLTAASGVMDEAAVMAAAEQRLTVFPQGTSRAELEVAQGNLTQFQDASRMARLSGDAYLSFAESDPVLLPDDAVRLNPDQLPADLGISKKDLMHEESGFYAAVYQVGQGKEASYVVAFRGTEDWTDWKTNISSLVSMTKQSDMAERLVEDILEAKGAENVMVTGHSLGGGLANYVALSHDIPSTTFNAKGITVPELLRIENPLNARQSITNYQVNGEILTELQKTPYILPAIGSNAGIPAIKPDGTEGNMLKEAFVKVVTLSSPIVNWALGGTNDISGPVDRHGMDYVERGMASATVSAKDAVLETLFGTFDSDPGSQTGAGLMFIAP